MPRRRPRTRRLLLAAALLSPGGALLPRVLAGAAAPSPPPARSAEVRQVAGGGYAAYALASDGTVWAWGDDLEGQLGNGVVASVADVPVHVRRLTGAVAVTASANSAYALRRDGSVWAWGDDGEGELGDGRERFTSELPVRVLAPRRVASIAAGELSAYALGRDGTVWAWGNNAFGELAQPLRVPTRDVPVEVRGLPSVTGLAAGASNAYALGRDGTVWAWGSNAFGELAQPLRVVARVAPLRVPRLDQVSAVAASAHAGFALRRDGTVWSWGDGSYGELGRGPCERSGASRCPASPRPAPVPSLRHVVAISAGTGTAYALEANGTVWAWGDGEYGQLGDAGTASSGAPVQVRGLGHVVAVAAGGTAAYALASDGTVWAWGDNAYGQLGDASTTSSDVPVRVRTLRVRPT